MPGTPGLWCRASAAGTYSTSSTSAFAACVMRLRVYVERASRYRREPSAYKTPSAREDFPDPDTPGDDQQADDEVLQAWGAGPAKIAPSAGNGTVTFYSWTQPTINIPIQVVVIT